jgi:hypothetical protein
LLRAVQNAAEASGKKLRAPKRSKTKQNIASLVVDGGDVEARTYSPSARFFADEIVRHAKFGDGLVLFAGETTMDVAFKEGTKRLAH